MLENDVGALSQESGACFILGDELERGFVVVPAHISGWCCTGNARDDILSDVTVWVVLNNTISVEENLEFIKMRQAEVLFLGEFVASSGDFGITWFHIFSCFEGECGTSLGIITLQKSGDTLYVLLSQVIPGDTTVVPEEATEDLISIWASFVAFGI